MIKRFRQGIRALFAWAQPVDFDLAASVLTPPLMHLFRQMRRSEQLHSLNVLRLLHKQGYTEPALLVAALLHDVGKTEAAFHLWDRVLVVLVRATAPSLVKRWGRNEPTGWSRPFAISQRHPEWSAAMVTSAGADPLTVELIARHQQYLTQPPTSDTERLLSALQAADDAN